MSCRADAKRVEAKGLFAGAEVVRGPNWTQWRFGDQDGMDYIWKSLMWSGIFTFLVS